MCHRDQEVHDASGDRHEKKKAAGRARIDPEGEKQTENECNEKSAGYLCKPHIRLPCPNEHKECLPVLI